MQGRAISRFPTRLGLFAAYRCMGRVVYSAATCSESRCASHRRGIRSTHLINSSTAPSTPRESSHPAMTRRDSAGGPFALLIIDPQVQPTSEHTHTCDGGGGDTMMHTSIHPDPQNPGRLPQRGLSGRAGRGRGRRAHRRLHPGEFGPDHLHLCDARHAPGDVGFGGIDPTVASIVAL